MSRIGKVISPTLQLFLGLVFLLSGLLKGLDPMGTALKINEYLQLFSFSFGKSTSLCLAILLNITEALVGLALILGWKPRLILRWILLFLAPMLGVTFYLMMENPISDCGCFGEAIKISNTATFWKNLLFFFTALYLYKRDQKNLSRWLTPSQEPWLLGIFLLSMLHINLYPILHLPLFDFRPYKIGASLKMLTQEGNEGKYDHKYIYQKGNETKSFTLDELEKVDSTWTFLRDESIEIEPPRLPLGVDFKVWNDKGEDLVPKWIDEKSSIILFVTQYSYEELSLADRLGQKLQYPIALLGSTPLVDVAETIKNKWQTFYLDHATLQTVIRNHPALLVISKGVIARKASERDIRTLIENPTFLKDPFSLQDPIEIWKRRVLLFAPLLLSILSAGVLAIKNRKRYS